MKKLLVLTIVTILSTANAAAQEESSWTLNTRAWSTNYFASSLPLKMITLMPRNGQTASFPAQTSFSPSVFRKRDLRD